MVKTEYPQVADYKTKYKENYIIYNFKHTKENELKIDSFVCNWARTVDTDKEYKSISFYKYSKKTNENNLSANKHRDLYSLENDYLWAYTFRDNKFWSKTTSHNAKQRVLYNKKLACWQD